MELDEETLARLARAELRRRTWQVEVVDLRATSTPPLLSSEEAIALVWRLTLDAWAMSGAPLPDYARSDMPIRVVHRPFAS